MINDWFYLTLIAGVFLGLYDIAKKKAVVENAVPPVLLANVLTAASVWIVLIFFANGLNIPIVSNVVQISWEQHGLLAIKSLMVGSSWVCAFFSLKHLPISIAAPIRATSPMWTVLLAVAFYQERPNAVQWLGILLILFAFLGFSFSGKKEGIQFRKNRWVGLMILATGISAFCGLYDKYLLQSMGLPPATVQAWFSIYLVPVMLPFALYWYCAERTKNRFQWRWSIPMIAILLLVADYTYFSALTDPEALISIVSPLRRTSLLIPFFYGIIALHEQNWKLKFGAILILLLGVFLIGLG